MAQRAAMLGREFRSGLLASVAGIDEAALRQGLGRLVERRFSFAGGEPPQAMYSFKHPLAQEAAYASLLEELTWRLRCGWKRARASACGRVL